MTRRTLPGVTRSLLAAVMGLAAIQGCAGGSDPEDGVGTTTAVSTVVESDSPSGVVGTVQVNQHQTGCCYVEGSIGLMQVYDLEGQAVSPVQASMADSESANGRGTWEPVELAPGRYRVDVWQYVCPGSCGDRDEVVASQDAAEDGPEQSRADLCSTDVLVEERGVVELTATWAPSEGCESFEEAA